MGEMPAIRDTGRHSPGDFRRVDPPIGVRVDLGALFPRAPHHCDEYQSGGLQLHRVVEGQLTCWGRSVQGAWFGLVTYPVAFGLQQKAVTHWVPAWALRTP